MYIDGPSAPIMSSQPRKPVPARTPSPPEDIARTDGTRLFRLINPELYAVRVQLIPLPSMTGALGRDYAGTHMVSQFPEYS
jgi:hypothetical protein